MTREQIRTVIELFISWNGETQVIDIANISAAIDFIYECLKDDTRGNISGVQEGTD